jgi:hypothetical protein
MDCPFFGGGYEHQVELDFMRPRVFKRTNSPEFCYIVTETFVGELGIYYDAESLSLVYAARCGNVVSTAF